MELRVVVRGKKAVKKEVPKKEKKKVVIARGKRKEAIARAVVCEGKGNVMINKFPLDSYHRYIRDAVYEPLLISGDAAKKLDIEVEVTGGGVMGQAEAAKTAIAKGIVAFTGDEGLKNKMVEHDRHLIVDDVRRVEPKKFKGPKARARFQKSYR